MIEQSPMSLYVVWRWCVVGLWLVCVGGSGIHLGVGYICVQLDQLRYRYMCKGPSW